ncbi:MAG TPA: flagellar biosynthesis protein FliQ [Thermodesulfobacteriaceae bacterium]|nr:flagellar biosynthesis protein FliQ [Thermodesulfobacteriaceae bacterium]
MTQEFVTGLAGQAIELTLLLSMPMLGTGLAVGLIVSIFQAVTQIQEMTLTFVPKIIAVLLALLFSFPWMMNKIIDFTRNLMEQIPVFIR